MACPFCDLDDEQGRIVAKFRTCYAMLSNPSLMPGHLLVIPKRHVLKPSELKEAERKEIFNTLLKYQDIVTQRYSLGCDIRQNYKPYVKQSMLKADHVHYHVLPRNPDDEMWFKNTLALHSLFKPLTEADRAKFTELYK